MANTFIGNYYQYGSATAGTGIGVKGTNATSASGAGLTNASGSICPKGWQLPKVGRNTSASTDAFGIDGGQSYDIDGSFFHLLKVYGYNSAWNINNGNGYMPINHAGRTANLAGSPIFFVRSGDVNPSDGSLRRVGSNGYSWSSTAFPGSSASSYDLGFNTTNVYPSNNDDRYTGFPVRCVAR